MGSCIPIRRRIEYGRGYLQLGLLKDAQAELDAIPVSEQMALDVLEVRIDLEMELKRWERVIAVAQHASEQRPAREQAWIAWAYALRELQRVEEAKVVLLQAEAVHGSKCGVLHYNLACYYCLLGDLTEAERRLKRACILESSWREIALDDPDLKALRARISSSD